MIRTATTVSHTVIMTTTMRVNIPLVLLAEYEAGGTASNLPFLL
jgi:hypothetical protein